MIKMEKKEPEVVVSLEEVLLLLFPNEVRFCITAAPGFAEAHTCSCVPAEPVPHIVAERAEKPSKKSARVRVLIPCFVRKLCHILYIKRYLTLSVPLESDLKKKPAAVKPHKITKDRSVSETKKKPAAVIIYKESKQ